MHRTFIAINLPEDIKETLLGFQEKHPQLPIRWTKKENLHITLIFLGSLSDEEMLEICKLVSEVGFRNKSFSVTLNKICYGPPEKMPPRMVWVQAKVCPEFAELQKNLEKSLFQSDNVHFSPEKRPFSPHITLGRIRTWEFKKIDPEDRPEVKEDISLDFDVSSIEVMESQLKRGGAEYTILESVPLSK